MTVGVVEGNIALIKTSAAGVWPMMHPPTVSHHRTVPRCKPWKCPGVSPVFRLKPRLQLQLWRGVGVRRANPGAAGPGLGLEVGLGWFASQGLCHRQTRRTQTVLGRVGFCAAVVFGVVRCGGHFAA